MIGKCAQAWHRPSGLLAAAGGCRSTPAEQRKLEAKRFNESVKLSAALANNLSVGVLIGGLVGPIMGGHAESIPSAAILFIVSAILHSYAKLLLSDSKSEE